MSDKIYALQQHEYISVISKSQLEVTDYFSFGSETQLYDMVIYAENRAIILCHKDSDAIMLDVDLAEVTSDEIFRLTVGEYQKNSIVIAVSLDEETVVLNTHHMIYAVDRISKSLIYQSPEEIAYERYFHTPERFENATLPVLIAMDITDGNPAKSLFLDLNTGIINEQETYNAIIFNRIGLSQDKGRLYAIGINGLNNDSIILSMNPNNGSEQRVTETEAPLQMRATGWQWTDIGLITGIEAGAEVLIVSHDGPILEMINTAIISPHAFYDGRALFTVGADFYAPDKIRINKYSDATNINNVVSEYLDRPEDGSIIIKLVG